MVSTEEENDPKVSAIIPCYNGEDFVEDAIRSVLDQTYDILELIVVDDGSTDNSKEVLQKYTDHNKISILFNDENRGIPASRNRAIREADGQFIAFLDQDDIWLENKLEKTIEVALSLENPGLIQTGLMKTNMEGDPEERLEKEGYSDMEKKNLIRDFFLREKPFYTASTILINSECFSDLGLMDERLTRWDDKEMWIRILADCSYDTDCIEEILVVKREHDNQATEGIEPLHDLYRLHEILLNKHPFLKEYADRHLADIYFSHAVRYWREGVSTSYVKGVYMNLTKSILCYPWNWKAYGSLLLALFGKGGYKAGLTLSNHI